MIGDKLRKLRREMDITQEEISKKLDISRGVYGNYETGVAKPPIDVLEKLADYFNVSTDYLLGRTEIKNYEDMKIEHKKEYSVSEKDIEYIKELYKKIKGL